MLFAGLIAAVALAVGAGQAAAASRLIPIAEDTPVLLANPTGTLAKFRQIGVTTMRVDVNWGKFAPKQDSRKRPKGFTLSKEADPNSYTTFGALDQVVIAAKQYGMQIDMIPTGSGPLWAAGPTMPKDQKRGHPQWDPSAKDFGAFVKALAKRYSGNFTPKGSSTVLPRVSFWSIWSEPNLGYALAPQGVPGHLSVENSGRLYRGLLSAAWSALHQTGHGNDTILFGEIAPRGITSFGLYQAMKPLQFVRALYCVDTHFHQLRGKAASERGCPTNAAGSRKFRSQNPALFQSSGFADHMWDRWYPPNKELQFDPDYTSLAEIGRLITTLNSVERVYGSSKHFKIYNTEFGYITNPPNNSVIHLPPLPKGSYPSPKTAAYYLNWAEYISWRNPQIVSFDQYLLADPRGGSGPYVGWSSGLLTSSGTPKVTYNAWALPLYMPVSSLKHGHKLELWGCARPVHFGILDAGGSEQVTVDFKPSGGGATQTLKTITYHSSGANCYFDTRLTFPGPGSVHLSYTYPSPAPLLPAGTTITSRTIDITK